MPAALRSARTCFLLKASLALLAACGGGGGGGGESAPPPSPSNPLVLRLELATPTAGIPLSIAESTLVLGRWAYEEVEAQRQRRVFAGTLQCPQTAFGAGTREFSYVDADGDGLPSPGDRLSLRFTKCRDDLLDSTLDGSVEVQLRAAAAGYQLGGVIRFDPGGLSLTPPIDTGDSSRLNEAIAFDALVDEDNTAMLITPAAGSAFALTALLGQRSVTERLTPIRIAHRIDRVSARYELSISARLNSSALVGQVDVSTPQPFAGWLETAPDSGSARITGAGSGALVVVPEKSGRIVNAGLRLDVDGDGNLELSRPLPWQDTFAGYPWWPQMRGLPGLPLLPLRGPLPEPSDTWIRPSPFERDLTNFDLRPTLSFEFAVPVDAARLPRAWLERQPMPPPIFPTNKPDSDWGPAAVDLTVTVNGARLTLVPTTQLQPGRSYRLRTRAQGASIDDQEALVTDVLGRSLITSARIHTRSDFSASAAFSSLPLPDAVPGELSVDGIRSRDARHPIVSYRWRQLSGPPLTLLTPHSPQSRVRIDGPPLAIPSRAMLELTVTNSVGEVDSAWLPVDLVPIPDAPPPLLYFRSTPGSFVGAGEVRVVTSGQVEPVFAPTGTAPLDVSIDVPSRLAPNPDRYSLRLVRGNQDPLAVGTYANPSSFFSTNDATSWTAVIMTVLEVETDAGGRVIRLAIDFWCDESPGGSRVHGSLRINSTLPVNWP